MKLKEHYESDTVLELLPINRQSFYGKAKVIIAKDGYNRFLKSYDTICCAIDAGGGVHRFDHRDSYTTRTHIKAFLKEKYQSYWDLPIEKKPSISVNL